jgi:type IX secretion system PorP/SprF family membrane protein
MNNIMKKIIISALALTSLTVRAQQDIHVSQFHSLPVFLNPATAGMFEGSIRFFGDYRTQWNSVTTPFTTISASLDAPFFVGKFENGSFFGGGLTFFHDQAGDSRFTTGNYCLSISYVLETSRDEYFSAGLQGGVLQKSISYSSLYYGSQWNGMEFNGDLASNEVEGARTSITKPDFALGIYYFNGRNDNFHFFGGISGLHVLAPTTNFFNVNDKLYRKYNVHGGCQVLFGNFALIPNFLTMFQGPNRVINIGTDYKWILREQSKITGFIDEISMSLATYLRVGDALFTGLRFNYAGFSLGAMYDYNISSLNIASRGNGGMEFYLGYRTGFGTGKGNTTRFL